MNPYRPVSASPRAPQNDRLGRWQSVQPIARGLALVSFGMLSVLGLGGCQAIEAIFKVGVWFGVLIVVAIVGVTGGILAMILRRK